LIYFVEFISPVPDLTNNHLLINKSPNLDRGKWQLFIRPSLLSLSSEHKPRACRWTKNRQPGNQSRTGWIRFLEKEVIWTSWKCASDPKTWYEGGTSSTDRQFTLEWLQTEPICD